MALHYNRDLSSKNGLPTGFPVFRQSVRFRTVLFSTLFTTTRRPAYKAAQNAVITAAADRPYSFRYSPMATSI